MSVVNDYEIFTNAKGAIMFFFYKQDILDENSPEGSFIFTVSEDSLFAGTKEYYVTFPNIEPDILARAKARGNILLMEMKDKDPFRATPCYFVEGF